MPKKHSKNQKTIYNLIKENNRIPNKKIIQSKYPIIFDEINKSWPRSLTEKSFAEKVYHYLFPLETVCLQGNHKSFQSFTKGYSCCQKHCFCSRNQKKQIMIDRYGVEYPLQSKKIRKKFQKTLYNRYGSDNLYDAFKSKREDTNIKKYGSKTPLESNKIRKLTQQSYEKNSGFSNPFEKINSDQTGIYQEKRNATREKNYPHLYDYDKIFNTLKYNSYTKSSEILNLYPTHLKNIAVKKNWNWLLPKKSSYERLIEDFLISHSVNYVKNSRSIIPPFELDFFIPDCNLAIEINGLRWHSEFFGKKDKKYHLNKTLMCQKQKIHLIHIFEDELNNLPDTVFSILKTFLNISKTPIYGRKCKLVELTTPEARDFCNRYHLQGYSSSSVRYGLKYNGELVSIMTFKKQNQFDYELSRYCIHPNFSVIGSAPKLFKKFEKEIDFNTIVTYSDNRYFTGNVYREIGFQQIKITEPGYWYFKHFNKRLHRLNFTKKMLNKQGFDKSLTEWEIMKSQGWDRVWDCGNIKWIKYKETS